MIPDLPNPDHEIRPPEPRRGGWDLLLEPLILYGILFLPGALRHEAPADLAVFSINREIIRIAAYNLPALALIWYLHRISGRSGGGPGVGSDRSSGRSSGGTGAALRPGLGDLFSFLLVLPALFLTGICVSRAAALFPGVPGGFRIEGPRDPAGYAAVFLSCLSTGYLEESYFRFYLQEKVEEFGLGKRSFLFISAALFSLCHLYEGPWGTMNSLLAALILALAYIRFRGLHGIALAHGFYNFGVYLLSGILNA
jgi:membrane protease YdiL (CAAX protease family)